MGYDCDAAPMTGNTARELINKFAWTLGAYGTSSILRLSSNIILARLLAPEILGIMVIVQSLRYGIELLTDVGIEQNIVHSRDGLDEKFLNTAWTLQILRGVMISAFFAAISPALADFYNVDRSIPLAMSAAPLINSLASTAIFRASKQLEVRKRNVFELTCEVLGFTATITIAAIWPSIWALVLGTLTTVTIRAALSYTLAHPRHRFALHVPYVRQIVSFGKWIVISSLLIYAGTHLDRMYLGKVLALDILGIYGLARIISEMPPALAGRLSYQIVFPYITTSRNEVAPDWHGFQTIRRRLVYVLGLVMGAGIAFADVAIGLMYDLRYHQAGWMLSMLLAGSWVAVLGNLNEGVLMGQGRPAYGSAANAARIAVLVLAIPIGYMYMGLPGAILGIAASEIARYVTIAITQESSSTMSLRQDGQATAILLFAAVSCLLARQFLGLGMEWPDMKLGAIAGPPG